MNYLVCYSLTRINLSVADGVEEFICPCVSVIMLEEVKAAVDKMKLHKAPGIDEISAKELQAATTGTRMTILWQVCQHVCVLYLDVMYCTLVGE